MAKVIWTDKEWYKLTDLVELMRLNDVTSGLVTLVNKAQQQLPENRRRVINTSGQVQLIVDELKKRYDTYRCLKDEVQSLRVRLQNAQGGSLSKSDILDNCTPQELLSRLSPEQIFQSVSVENLVSEATRRFVVSLTEKQVATVVESAKPVIHQDQIQRKGTKRVCILGPLPNQQNILRKDLESICDLTFVGSDNDRIPENQHYYVNWTNFSSHSRENKCKSLCSEPSKQYVRVSGGLNNIILTVQQLLVESN